MASSRTAQRSENDSRRSSESKTSRVDAWQFNVKKSLIAANIRMEVLQRDCDFHHLHRPSQDAQSQRFHKQRLIVLLSSKPNFIQYIAGEPIKFGVRARPGVSRKY